MRKYLLGLFAIVMAVSLSAFTSAKPSKEAGKSANLYWFLYDAASGTGTYLGFGDKNAFKVSGCDKEAQIDCRRGYPSSALTNPSVPGQGVIDDDDHEDQIRKQ